MPDTLWTFARLNSLPLMGIGNMDEKGMEPDEFDNSLPLMGIGNGEIPARRFGGVWISLPLMGIGNQHAAVGYSVAIAISLPLMGIGNNGLSGRTTQTLTWTTHYPSWGSETASATCSTTGR